MSESSSADDFPYYAIVEQSLAGIYVIQDERFQYVNTTFAGMIGYTTAEMTGASLRDIVPADFVDEVLDRYYRRLSGNPPSMRFITRGRHKDGRVVMVEVHGSRMMYRGRPAVVGVGVDVTERLRQEEELRKSQAQLQELTAYINTVREDQRAKFARELHDVLGGMLTSIKMDVTRIRRRVSTPDLVEITRDLLDLTQEAIDAVREISDELRPGVLDHLGLTAAIERELGRFSERYGIECSIAVEGTAGFISPQHATGAYRIFQEALTNIARHSAATRVAVRIEADAAQLRMEVLDNGRGLDRLFDAGRSLGVLSMRERARELGGTIELGLHRDGGTRLYLAIPVTLTDIRIP